MFNKRFLFHVVECSNLDGENRRVIRSDVKYPFGLTHYGHRLFWTDWEE